MTQALLVENDVHAASQVQNNLQQHGFTVRLEQRGDHAVKRVLDERPELVLLALTLPGKDGFDVCRELRPQYAGPIVMLSARDDEIDQILGLELGADDYVTKPVKPRLLLARLRALMRRCEMGANVADSTSLKFGRLSVTRDDRQVCLDGNPVRLSTCEFELLWNLTSHAGDVLSRENLLYAMRGIHYDGLDRSVDIAVSRLR